MDLSFERRRVASGRYQSEFGSDGHGWGSEGYGRSIAGMNYSSTGQYSGRGSTADSQGLPDASAYTSFQTGYGNITGLEGTGAGNDAPDVKGFDSSMTDAEEAAAYGLTIGQLKNARHFEALGGEVKDGVFPTDKPYADAQTGKLVDPGGLARAEGYGMRGGDIVQRNAFGAGGVDFLGDYGKIAMGLFPGMTMGFMAADKFGLMDMSYDDPNQQNQFAEQQGYGGHGHGHGNSEADPVLGMPTEGLGLATTAPAPTSAPAKGPLLADWFKSNPDASDIRIRQAQDKNGWSNADVAAAMRTDPSMWSARYNAATPYFQFTSMVDNALADRMADNPSQARLDFMGRTPTQRRA